MSRLKWYLFTGGLFNAAVSLLLRHFIYGRNSNHAGKLPVHGGGVKACSCQSQPKVSKNKINIHISFLLRYIINHSISDTLNFRRENLAKKRDGAPKICFLLDLFFLSNIFLHKKFNLASKGLVE